MDDDERTKPAAEIGEDRLGDLAAIVTASFERLTDPLSKPPFARISKNFISAWRSPNSSQTTPPRFFRISVSRSMFPPEVRCACSSAGSKPRAAARPRHRSMPLALARVRYSPPA
jgi:hypothetical protein